MKILTFIALLSFTFDLCHAQIFDVENERLPEISILEVKSFNGCCAKKGFSAKYYFNDKGQAIKSEQFFRRQKRAEYEYRFDSIGSLIYKISTYNINNLEVVDTVAFYYYAYDSEKRIIKKTSRYSPNSFWTEEYTDFSEFNKPKKVLRYSSTFPDTLIQILEYNQKSKLISIKLFYNNDSLITNEILDYNKQGDLSYSLIPSLVGQENEPLAIWVGGTRHAPEERYEYLYDKQNRWIKKILIYRNKKVLLEKRKYN
ncbi:MAG: hypothetical protein KFKLKKLM_00747 [Flavobacteriales bacterium]|nr:hypothetical protein [Flavobacteriales bacterium]